MFTSSSTSSTSFNTSSTTSLIELELTLSTLKKHFLECLCKNMGLVHVQGPLFLLSASGLNDHLCSVERPVTFEAKSGEQFEVIHSLAKWKRSYLGKSNATGIVADMCAIRRDEILDDTHSYLVDQWDWEKVLGSTRSTRSKEDLLYHAKLVYETLKMTAEFIGSRVKLPDQFEVISSSDLESLYPNTTPEEREYLYVKEHGAIFVTEIGYIHGSRAFDYDDWSMNGDLIIYDEVHDRAIELSSMGVRVDKTAMLAQHKFLGLDGSRLDSDYHRGILDETLPQTIGGGIGQSRVSMFLLQKKSIAEVQP